MCPPIDMRNSSCSQIEGNIVTNLFQMKNDSDHGEFIFIQLQCRLHVAVLKPSYIRLYQNSEFSCHIYVFHSQSHTILQKYTIHFISNAAAKQPEQKIFSYESYEVEECLSFNNADAKSF